MQAAQGNMAPESKAPSAAGAEDGALAGKKRRRSRQNFTWNQLSVLEKVFETDPLPRQALLVELSERLDITPRCVQVWFQNRRQKFKATHQANGQVPPPLKNASVISSSLETLLPDLAPSAESQHATPSQLRESAPKMLQMQTMTPAAETKKPPPAIPGRRTAEADDGPTSAEVAYSGPDSMSPGSMALAAARASADAAGFSMWHASATGAMPVSLEHLQTASLIGMNGPHPVMQLGTPTDADAASRGRYFVQLPNGSLMHLGPDGACMALYTPISYLQPPFAPSDANCAQPALSVATPASWNAPPYAGVSSPACAGDAVAALALLAGPTSQRGAGILRA